MSPTIDHKDLIICTKANEFVQEKVYVITTNQGDIWVKRVRKTSNSLIMMSDNPRVHTFQIDAIDARAFYKILKIIKTV